MAPKIILYEHGDFGGRTLTCTQSFPNLVNVGFNDTVSSVDVQGGVWILYADINYQGDIYVVKEGDRVNLSGYNDKASSIKLINYNFSNPPICTLFADSNFGGRNLQLQADALNLKWYDFNDKVSSIWVHSGAWVAYNDSDFRGQQSFYLQGGHSLSATEGPFPNDRISSMRAIQIIPSGPITILKFDFDLARAIISTKPTVVFQWTQRNDSSVEQTLTITQEKSVTKDNTYEFHWNQGTRVTASLEMDVGIPVLAEGTLTMSVEASYEVGAKSGTKTSKTEKWAVKFPSKIPARTQIILSSVLTEGRYDVPYTAVLKQDNNTWTEKGIFQGVNYYGFVTNFKEEPL